MKRIRWVLVLTPAAVVAAGMTAAPAKPPPGASDCTLFPRDNHWNRRVDRLPVHPRSRKIVSSVGRQKTLHPDFGSGTWNGGPIGIPFTTVAGDQPRVPVAFGYEDESDPGPYPIPPNAPVEGGSDADGDRHVIVVDRDDCVLYELFDARPHDEGARWTAGSGARWDLDSNALRPKGWTSADAAGLPILPGLARFDEVVAGEMDHALRSRCPERAATTSIPRVTSPRLGRAGTCRPWGSASGSRGASTSRGFLARRESSFGPSSDTE